MKPSLKKMLMTLTILSAGMCLYSPYAAQAAFKTPKIKPVAVDNSAFKQYPKLGEAKEDVNMALELHQKGVALLSDRQTLESYKESIEKYNEIKKRLDQNVSCNKTQLRTYFQNADEIWKKVSAWAEDTSEKLLADASDSLGEGDSSGNSGKLADLEKQMDAGDSSASTVGSEQTAYSGINADTTVDQANAMAKSGADAAEAEANAAEAADADMDDLSAFGKIRWDVGFTVLKDLYKNQTKWGSVKKQFTPWVDQKKAYDAYLVKHYEDMEKSYISTPLNPFPKKPTMDKSESYLPQDYYNGDVPDVTVSDIKYDVKAETADDVWCGETNGMKNVCPRVSKGALISKHRIYTDALKRYPLKDGYTHPVMNLPFLPEAPLPPWRESVYLVNVEKEIPQLSSDLPEPWRKVTKSIDYFTSSGELANLVERHGKTVRYRPEDYNAETGEIKTDKNGNPKLPLPLMQNRISSYLALNSALVEQEPIKDRAIASIRELNEKVIATLEKVGFTVPNKDTFSLINDSDYQTALQALGDLQEKKAKSAEAKMNEMKASFGAKLLPSVQQMINEEQKTLNALRTDKEFMVDVNRSNAGEIKTLLLTAIADAAANSTYKENLANKMSETSAIPEVGCPIL